MSRTIIAAPTPWQRRIVRAMIIIGIGCMAFFCYSLLRRSVVGYLPLYWLLISTFFYTFFKILFEWYHYWSIDIPQTPTATKHYSVDIFTTFCAGEPYQMVVDTLIAIQAVTYPHQTYLCDEDNDPYLKNVCEQLGVHHITRADKAKAKAGNINNALKLSSGELCVVLDPDHKPQPDLLDPIVAHFNDPKVGFVQIVQAYHNQNTGWIAKGASQQTYQFYGPMMMCMNRYGTVQAIGANCTFRRAALESIGGHAAGLAEDMNTAMHLHAQGWRSVYLPAVLTHGLVPATMSAYFKQQLKWSRGVFELLVTSYPKLFTKLSLRQKLHYGLIPMFYLSGFVFLINFLIPMISLFVNVYPLQMDFSHFIVISIPFITSVILIRHYVQRWVMDEHERGFHIIGGLLLIGTWWIFITGFIYTIIRKKVPYIPTPKDLAEEKNFKINLPNVIILGCSIASIGYGLINDWNPFTFFMVGVAALNCLFMIFMILAAEQFKLRAIRRRLTFLAGLERVVKELKGHFWLFRRRLYSGVRTLSLMLAVLSVCISIYIATDSSTDVVDDHPVFTKRSGITNGAALPANAITLRPNYLLNIKGVVYTKGHFWYKNTYPLTKKIILKDFGDMRKAGINTVKIYGPNVYDYSTLEAARSKGIKIQYSFWIPDELTTEYMDDLASSILKTVGKFKDNDDIVSWNVGNDPLRSLANSRKGTQLSLARSGYLKWLNKLVADIKKEDNKRIVTADVVSSADLQQTISLLKKNAPLIDAFGLIISDKADLVTASRDLTVPYFFASVDPAAFTEKIGASGGVFYANWQDQEAASVLTFDGLKDKWGRNKPYLNSISRQWNGSIPNADLPPVKILRPALTTSAGATLNYKALVYVKNQWEFAGSINTRLKFEWYLVHTDSWGKAMSMNQLGSGNNINLTVPPNSGRYKIYLVASKDNGSSTSDLKTLNTPLN